MGLSEEMQGNIRQFVKDGYIIIDSGIDLNLIDETIEQLILQF